MVVGALALHLCLPKHCHPRVSDLSGLNPFQPDWIVDGVLNGQNGTKRDLHPPVHDTVQLSRPIRGIRECDVVRHPVDLFHERDSIALEDTSAVGNSNGGNIRLERVQGRRIVLDKVTGRCPARERLQPDRTTAGEQVDDARIGQIVGEEIQPDITQLLGGWPHSATR